MARDEIVKGILDLLPGIGDNGGPLFRGLETIDLPPGSRPEYLGKAPNRTIEFPRYVPAKGTTARMQRLIAAADDPANPINALFDRYIEKGRTLGGEEWYNTEELRNWFIDLYGDTAGDARWRDYIQTVGATSTGSDVPSNLRNASFYYTLNPTDRRAVAELVAQGGTTPADAAARLGLDVPNMPDNYRYGHVMQANHAKNILAQLDGRWDQMIPEGLTQGEISAWLKANPKVKGFYNDLLGSESNIAADKHFMRMLAMSDGGLDFLGEQAQLSGANLEKLRGVYGEAIEPYIQTRKTGTGQLVTQVNLKKAAADGVVKDTELFRDVPQAWLDTPNDNEYAALEEMAQRLSRKYDMTPAQFQAALWMGAGDITGLADESQGTFMELFRRSLDKRAGERDTSRMRQFMDFAARQSPLAVGVPVAGGLLAGEADAQTPAAAAEAPQYSPEDARARALGYGSYAEMLGEGTLEPRVPTTTEDVGAYLGDKLYRVGQDLLPASIAPSERTAQASGRDMAELWSWIPGVGAMMAGDQAKRDVEAGDYVSAVINAVGGLLDAAGVGLATRAGALDDVYGRVVRNGMVDVSDTPAGRDYFSRLLGEARDAQGPIGRSVDVYDPAGYAGTRMRITPEGDAGYIVKPDGELASLVKHPDSSIRGFAGTALRDADDYGATWLNAFDTALTPMYGAAGYRPVSRIPFSEEFAREGWGDEAVDAFMAAAGRYNGGRPDLVFMARDPSFGGMVANGRGGLLADDWDAAVAELERELGLLQGAPQAAPAGLLDNLRAFAADESGAIRAWPAARNTPEGRAQDILDMLASGRGPEVTDEMLDLGDPVQNARLNQYLFNNYDLPMDEASRMARAREMGLDSEFPMYHGSVTYDGEDAISAFRPGQHDETALTGTSFAYDPRTTDWYSLGGRWGNEEGGTSYPAFLSQRREDFDEFTEPFLDDWEKDFMTEAKRQGVDALDMSRQMGDEVVALDPTRIRSRFARFDPRLAHLRNLSAGIAGLGLLATPEDIEAYLAGAP